MTYHLTIHDLIISCSRHLINVYLSWLLKRLREWWPPGVRRWQHINNHVWKRHSVTVLKSSLTC